MNPKKLSSIVIVTLLALWTAVFGGAKMAEAGPVESDSPNNVCTHVATESLVYAAHSLYSNLWSDIYISNADGSGEKMLVIPDLELPYNDFPKWSWDKQQIVFTKRIWENETNSEEIFIMDWR
ncbi:MAG: hypothetical protein HY326_04345 [Chloroflexi bacterium]|nr:hypothetical protein [Chloroflexota bacterium]